MKRDDPNRPRTDAGTYSDQGLWKALTDDERRARRAKAMRDKRAADPEGVRARERARKAKDPEKWRAINRAHREANIELYRERERVRALKRYGLTLDQWDAIFESQGRKCKCCGTTTPGGRHLWVTDHDHATDLIRGILCNHCNTTLGLLGDNAEGVRSSSERFLRYLEG